MACCRPPGAKFDSGVDEKFLGADEIPLSQGSVPSTGHRAKPRPSAGAMVSACFCCSTGSMKIGSPFKNMINGAVGSMYTID